MVSYLFLAVATLQGVKAWGSLGHATIAYIAQNYLTDEVATWAQGVLNDPSDSYLANVATWADSFRYETAGRFSAPFHYIDAEDDPPTSCGVDFDRDCGDTGCIVSAIANYTQRVGDGRLSAIHTQQALKFLVHFLGDITQPLHAEAYEVGGNNVDVTYEGEADNLHSIWDTDIPETLIGGYALTDALGWANVLIGEIDSGSYANASASWIEGDSPSAAQDSAMTWASDSNAYVCTVVMPDGAAVLTASSDLHPTYYDSVISTVEIQVAKAGYRLGNWLNLIYTSEIAKRDGLGEGQSRSRPAKRMWTDAEMLPAWRPMSRAKMARAEAGYNCNHSKRDGEDHHH